MSIFNEYAWIFIKKESIANLKLLTDRTAIFRKIRRPHALRIEGRDSFSHEELIGLMKRMPNVHRLSCSNVILDQAFFDELPTTLQFLYILEIWRRSNLRNVSFILRFPELTYFRVQEPKYSDENRRIGNVYANFAKRKALDFSPKK